MKTINYKNKKLKLPYDLKDGELSTELVTRQNPFSGESIPRPTSLRYWQGLPC